MEQLKASYSSLPVALKAFFGMDMLTTQAEFKKLNEKDKADFREMFEKVGITIQAPQQVAAA